MPTSTIVTTAFITPARLAAKNLQIPSLPLIVTPHPLNDLTPEEVKRLAQAVYPLIVTQLTSAGKLEENVYADFVHPRGAKGAATVDATNRKGSE